MPKGQQELSFIPALAILGLLWLVWRLDRAYPTVGRQSQHNLAQVCDLRPP